MTPRLSGLLVVGMLATAHADIPPIPDLRLTPFASGFTQPVYLTGDPEGHIYVVEQAGVIWRLDPSDRERHLRFLDIRDRVRSGGELGLLGLALHPDFAENRRFFVNYTTGGRRDTFTRVSSFLAPPSLNRAAEPATEIVHLAFRQPFANHNGGDITFGPDRLLYIGSGDGGGANDPRDYGQRLDTFLGKILRIRVDTFSEQPQADPEAINPERYELPPDNPFLRTPDALPEIYAYGLRNPWRLSFDRETGLLYAGDVGQWHREEISVITAGGNYGWRIAEGNICTPFINPSCDQTGLIPPIIDYTRDEGISVTGGHVYRGTNWPTLRGVYLYGDYGTGRIWGLRYDGTNVTAHRLLLTTDHAISSFGEDRDGELYVVDHGGRILRIETAPPQP